MREDLLAPVQGKGAGDGASSRQMGQGSGMASQKVPTVCFGALLGLPPIRPWGDRGEEDLEFPGKAPQTPATPSTGQAIPW